MGFIGQEIGLSECTDLLSITYPISMYMKNYENNIKKFLRFFVMILIINLPLVPGFSFTHPSVIKFRLVNINKICEMFEFFKHHIFYASSFHRRGGLPHTESVPQFPIIKNIFMLTLG